ncbi:DUF6417 family protein [Streptomyces sp. SID12488]|uniref:DUF6417 family protein n=1 Tax=Streptomyces sp. SID12488 TaxID=2706040 RepID=UPI0013DC0753|nr:DUF6417 family protein [Streptomyces sp. SID12488]NEA65348.1 hypothetical protein [Streptomyces sp. SID12488]
MDDYSHLDLDEIDFDMEPMADRLALLTLEEAHDLRQLLLAVAEERGPESAKADRWAREIAARVPSEDWNSPAAA